MLLVLSVISMSFHIALQSGNANQVSSIYILSFHNKQSLPSILPTLQHSKLYRQARQAVQPWPATSWHFLSKGAPNENLQKNTKSWLEHRNSYRHVFSLKIEASMNPLLHRLSNFQVLQSDLVWTQKWPFFSGVKKRDLPNGESIQVTLKETGGQLLMWSKTRFQSDSKLSPSCASTPYLSSWDFLVAGETPVISKFRVLYKWLPL